MHLRTCGTPASLDLPPKVPLLPHPAESLVCWNLEPKRTTWTRGTCGVWKCYREAPGDDPKSCLDHASISLGLCTLGVVIFIFTGFLIDGFGRIQGGDISRHIWICCAPAGLARLSRSQEELWPPWGLIILDRAPRTITFHLADRQAQRWCFSSQRDACLHGDL